MRNFSSNLRLIIGLFYINIKVIIVFDIAGDLKQNTLFRNYSILYLCDLTSIISDDNIIKKL